MTFNNKSLLSTGQIKATINGLLEFLYLKHHNNTISVVITVVGFLTGTVKNLLFIVFCIFFFFTFLLVNWNSKLLNYCCVE